MRKLSLFTKLTICLFAFIFSCQTLEAQENSLTGYIVNQDGDSLKGSLEYKMKKTNPEKILFKENGGQSMQMGPSDIKAFGSNKAHFVSAGIQYSTGKADTDTPELKLKKDLVFLKKIVGGPKSLYYYKSEQGNDNYYIQDGKNFTLLIYKQYLKKEDGRQYTAENKKFIGQLMLYFSDCPALHSSLQKTSYTQKSLTKIFLRYYDCIPEKSSFVAEAKKLSTEAGFLVGGSLASLIFEGDKPYLTEVDFGQSTDLVIGIFLNIVLDKEQNKWSLANELTYNSLRFEAGYTNVVHENKYTITLTTFDYTYLTLNNMIRYRYPLGDFALFANAGMSNGFAINALNQSRIQSILFDSETIRYTEAISGTRNWELGYILGLGAEYKNFLIQARFKRGNGFSDISSLKSSTNCFIALIGYRF